MSNHSVPPAQPAAPTNNNNNQRSSTTTTSSTNNTEDSPNISTIDATNSKQVDNISPSSTTNSTSKQVHITLHSSSSTSTSSKSLIRTNSKHNSSSKQSATPSNANVNNSSSVGVITSLPHTFFSSPQPPIYPPAHPHPSSHPHNPSPIAHPLAHPSSPYHPHPSQPYQPPPPPFPPYPPAAAAAAATAHFFPPGHHHHHHHMYPMAQPHWPPSSDPFAPPPPPHAHFFPWSTPPVPSAAHAAAAAAAAVNQPPHRSHDSSHKHNDYLSSHPHHHLPLPLPHRQSIHQSRTLLGQQIPSSIPFYDRNDERDLSNHISSVTNRSIHSNNHGSNSQKGRGKNRRGNHTSNSNNSISSNSNVGNTIGDSHTSSNNVSTSNNISTSHRSHSSRSNNSSSTNVGSTNNANNNSANNNSNTSNCTSEADSQAATLELNKAAKKAVDAGDDFTLSLLLTSWANSLEEAQEHSNGSGRQFETIFLASQALEIVNSDILLKDSHADSPVRQALLSLQRFILYGPDALHIEVADRAVALNAELEKKTDASEKARCLQERQTAFSAVSAFLKELAANLQAYKDILPESKPSQQSSEPHSPVANGVESGSGPAGPDPTKIVERSMDEWRRAVARLQGEMALVVILQKALTEVGTLLNPPTGSVFIELDTFYVTVQQKIKDCITDDLEKRIQNLKSENWQQVAAGAEQTVFKAARDRADMWISQFESSRREIESQLDDAGIGFGPSARVPENKFSVLVSASARVAALVSCHQHAFVWAKETSKLLHCMVIAFESLEKVGSGNLVASSALRSKFFQGLKDTFSAIDTVVNWSFSSLHDKVLGSLEKSTNGISEEGNTQVPKVRQLRFTVPAETVSKDDGTNESGMTPSQGRRKPRHARMKSSPDALLHLNANFNEFPDSDGDVDGTPNVERDGEVTEEKESESSIIKGDESGSSTVSSHPETTGKLTSSEATKNTSQSSEGDELPVVYEGKPLECKEDEEEDEDDKDIIVHEDIEDSSKPKKTTHPSHIRSMSVDGIPF